MSESTVEITGKNKLYPEEDYEFEGTVNGKKWEAIQETGMGAMTSVDTAEDDVDLTDDELDAVFEAIHNH